MFVIDGCLNIINYYMTIGHKICMYNIIRINMGNNIFRVFKVWNFVDMFSGSIFVFSLYRRIPECYKCKSNINDYPIRDGFKYMIAFEHIVRVPNK